MLIFGAAPDLLVVLSCLFAEIEGATNELSDAFTLISLFSKVFVIGINDWLLALILIGT